MTRRSHRIAVVCLAALSACGGSSERLELVTESPVAGTSGEAVRIELRLLDEEDRAVSGVEVRFALEDATEGTSLRERSATTDSRGQITALVTLGAEGALTLMVSSDNALPVTVPIAIESLETAYDLCAADPTGCNSPQVCTMITTTTSSGAICSVPCTSAGDCPAAPPRGAQCVDFQGMGGTCMRGCALEGDCHDTDTCAMFTDQAGVTSTICIPTE